MSSSLLVLLADGRPWEVGQLLDALSLSFEDLQIEIACLREKGISISNAASIYQLDTQVELLDSESILSNIATFTSPYVSELNIQWSIDSTNNHCLRKLQSGESISGFVCLAEHQYGGRGRRGRCWISPVASSIYLSIGWRFEGGIRSLDGLSLAVGLVIANLLEEDFSVNGIGLKWPNDILCHGKKLGGVLIDVVQSESIGCDVVVGVGINVDMARAVELNIDQPWTDLCRATGRQISRNLLAACVIRKLIQLLYSYESYGFSHYQKQWSTLDVFRGRCVSVGLEGNRHLNIGVSEGVTCRGDLILNVDGVKRVFSAGEVSLRNA